MIFEICYDFIYLLLQDLMQLAEDYVKFCCQAVLDENRADLELIDAWAANKAKRDAKVKKKGAEDNTRTFTEPAVSRMEKIASSGFTRISYTEAVELLNKSDKIKKLNKPAGSDFEWGEDLPSTHERYLAEEVYNGPVIVYDYPKKIKAFYMRGNEDGKTVAAMDVLCPQIGELIGGSQR